MQVSPKLLNKEQVYSVLKRLTELKEHWSLRGNYIEEIPFYSLGAAAYMDISENGYTSYQKLFTIKNQILKENFSDLYEIVFKELERLYNKPFELYEKAAYPGFHIFLTDEVFEIPLAARHVDLQYRQIEWADIEIDKSKSISFTLYIKLPKNGGGVYYWEKFLEDFDGLDIREREEILHQTERKLKTFDEGDMFIHNGHQYHQIAPFFDIEEGDERISLQGHAIYSPNKDKYFVHW